MARADSAFFDQSYLIIQSFCRPEEEEDNHKFERKASGKSLKKFSKKTKVAEPDSKSQSDANSQSDAKSQSDGKRQPLIAGSAPAAHESMSELRKKLHAKIATLREENKRKMTSSMQAINQLATDKGGEQQTRKKRRKEAAALSVLAPASPRSPSPPPSPPEDFSFGSFIQDDDGLSNLEKMKKKRQSSANLLHSIQAFDAKVSDMTAEDQRAVLAEQAIANALLKAKGGKVKDNAKLLKKTIKRKEKQKKKSKAEWGERTRMVAKTMRDKQKKRTENIQARITAKKAKNKGKRKR